MNLRLLRRLEIWIVLVSSFGLACVMTYPLLAKLGSGGRVDNNDGQFSIWNVAWVARTLIVDPRHLFDANIFYPNTGTLAYSENNIGAGLLAVPVYWATRNPYAAHNASVLIAFMLCATGMYGLVRHLTGDRRAAAVTAILFAFCPYVFAHTAHIQLLMTAGLPFTMLAFHRVVERPTIGRGAQLGLAMAAQAVSCGYYGVFAVLMIGFAVMVVLATPEEGDRPLSLGKALLAGAAVALVIVTPLFLPYLAVQRAGFGRDLEEAARYSANWQAYVASGAYAHAWMLPHVEGWSEVLFPGFTALVFGVAALGLAGRSRRKRMLALYGGLTALAVWMSLGPAGRLYSALYAVVPAFSLLRAPARFGLLAAFGLSVLAGLALAALLPKGRRGTIVAVACAVLALAELKVPFPFADAPTLSPAYRVLATLPRGAVIEMPFFYPSPRDQRHTMYMLSSTTHWMPLVNGYSDYIPPDFAAHVMTLAPFPSRDGFHVLERGAVRYAVFHMYGYNEENRRDVLARLKEFESYLRPLYMDEQTRLYEIVGFPP